MRLIDADELEKQAEEARTGARDYYEDCGMEIIINLVEDAPTVNAVIIPEGATNGDVIKAIFPNEVGYGEGATCIYYRKMCFDLDWWNSPYRKE